MAQHIEWVHTSEKPDLFMPQDVADLSDDGNTAGYWGLGAGEVMIYGDPLALWQWLEHARALLAETVREATNDAIMRSPEHRGCTHDWQLFEDGYERTWVTEWAPGSPVVRAGYTGTEDWTEAGDGSVMLRCRQCLRVIPVPDGVEIEYH